MIDEIVDIINNRNNRVHLPQHVNVFCQSCGAPLDREIRCSYCDTDHKHFFIKFDEFHKLCVENDFFVTDLRNCYLLGRKVVTI